MSQYMKDVLAKFYKNPAEKREETIKILCKIADNILGNPTDKTFRKLQKTNPTINNKILCRDGGKELLTIMGFQEKDAYFEMPIDIPINRVQEFRKLVVTLNPKQKQREITYSNSLLYRLQNYSANMIKYENKQVQKRILDLMPIWQLEEDAQKKLRAIHWDCKKNHLPEPNISLQDTLIHELLRWFKEDFFDWVNTLPCEFCRGETVMSHVTSNPHMYADRVEMHKCTKCQKFTPFPRYNDLNILLETRRGRCGEWADVFTLCCRAMGWDTRFVVDEEDHVWTEVFSIAQKRWLHCDPCENILDTPLVYENGWNKKLSYVMAYSVDDIQDVTWRYTTKYQEVLGRRKQCTEAQLLNEIFKIRTERQKNLSIYRKAYLVKRNAMELAEFLSEGTSKEGDSRQRSSGSESWRLARGEMRISSEYVWEIKPSENNGNTVSISYSCALNKYKRGTESGTSLEIDDWNLGAYEVENMFRKIENDWKMVYLARNDGVLDGKVRWVFRIDSSGRKLDNVRLEFGHETFENGLVTIKISYGDNMVTLPKGETKMSLDNLKDIKTLTVEAIVSGGKGDTSWQHAQLFRQSIDSTSYPFNLTFTFLP
ncbi:peptide-N(4)-(N-acetyl-beta-glucosaminyl)asparagine amidase [Diorhabda carinulata]|uniref:peptide-N(4)-(N-acetyl-beta- glucosaminyl)asparagine amidase n=1 Tax=Diorhabda carinulata TaxID=1163345 RepID=UPI0025A15516|nr:peptide-N(4)-(N-acetyl-beta-glucosaminyl)asparagine amidase [Diorhabda carinulata]XP_057664019.1 peptide-N(4)-(N-acetyl-beta-glucosaminyl)asparagine amidase [Diorhabda carinulata]